LFWFRSVRMFLTVGCALLISAGVCRAESAKQAKKPSHKSPSHESASRRPKTAARHSGRARLIYAAEHKKTSSRHRRRSRRKRGQQKIDSQRAREIQDALIREHYLDGKPSGVWDSKTQRAMERYQGDNGWQTKTTPDARALIKLGLGPDRAHLLNPESAMTSSPEASTPASTNSKRSTKAKALPTAAREDQPAVKPAATSEAAAHAAPAPANDGPAPAADPSPETKPQK
jgi:Putative peptidoglycan binding domain